MLPLIGSLLLIGLSSPSHGIPGDAEPRERFITLRDYDFVGEDATLRAHLARRMAVLQAPPSPAAARPAARPAAWSRWQRDHIQIKPDFLPSNLKRPQMVNVSLDYDEIHNASYLFPDTNESSPALDSAAKALGAGPVASLVPSPGATLVPGRYADVALDLDIPNPDEGPSPNSDEGPSPNPDIGLDPDSNPGSTPAPNASAQRRRAPVVSRATDPNNFKILDLMKHNIYGTQRKVLELDDVIKKFQGDPRFRMAYIYNRLDEWKHNLRTLYHAMVRDRYWHLRIKSLLWYYEHALRIDIDVTYSIEHLLHLHSEYMKKMEFIVPLATRQAIEEKKKLERKQRKMKEMGFPEGTIV
ncbi:hypothetical protein PYW08_004774 [Mythimna loreyi]|uniref:Uncharacterized protein n=1 Tax=Mythimna loreyi TaxID=667449 RepID=A0ACC2QDR1_9NEOP|nr:hypothetical protein PYW08_004774 [Mythimna loreyi]